MCRVEWDSGGRGMTCRCKIWDLSIGVSEDAGTELLTSPFYNFVPARNYKAMEADGNHKI